MAGRVAGGTSGERRERSGRKRTVDDKQSKLVPEEIIVIKR